MGELAALRRALREASPALVDAAYVLADRLIPASGTDTGSCRSFNDPIWKIVTLSPLQAMIVDLPLLQRLRRVRQLGLAHMVYPGAHHSRLEHSIGALQAARHMFDHLSATSPLRDADIERLGSIICIAALVHDCGHPAFSHVGERVLKTMYHGDFAAVRTVLEQKFPDPLKAKEPATANANVKPPPAAELMSALLVTSPAMEAFLAKHKVPDCASTCCLMVCGLILGRPVHLQIGDDYYHFVRSIISGDLDADKLDYVARDAYFAGLPVSADPDRLLSQLVTAQLNRGTNFQECAVEFGSPNPERYHLLGIRPAGVSALEMFVMTRSYLFERVYGHHKIRAAERFVERIIRQRVGFGDGNAGWTLERVLEFFYDAAGDDAVLGSISHLDEIYPNAKPISDRAKELLDRHLPQRAAALSPRFLKDFSKDAASLAASAFLPWNIAEAHLLDFERCQAFETELCNRSGTRVSHQTIIDWPVPNPIKEDPDIWVVDETAPNSLIRLNRYFDVEQLSNAYRDVKQVAWIFAPPEKRAEVAAVASLMAHEKFDMLVGPEATRRAKISASRLEAALKADFDALNDEQRVFVNDILAPSLNDALLLPRPAVFEEVFNGIFEAQERSRIAERLARKFFEAKLSRAFSNELYFALSILRYLAQHAQVIWRGPQFRDPAPAGQNEKRFQQHLKDYFQGNDAVMRNFDLTEHESASGGFTDIVFRPKGKGRSATRPLVCELKSEMRALSEMYEAHGGQSSQYAERDFARLSILYCQFRDESPVSPSDTLDVRCIRSGDETTHLILCIGAKGFSDTPSSLGHTSEPV